jgi:MoaA/NifB/PqqE/SkfB family radical SAM enzyme
VNGSDLLQDLSGEVSVKADKKIISAWPDSNPQFWKDISELLPTIKFFEIFGGEPFLINQHFKLLERSVELGYSKNQRLHYNSNGTIFPERAISEIWPNFENVELMLSIDGIGKQFEYQRHPANWKLIEENILKFKNVFSMRNLHICMTVSSINAYYLPEYIKYFHSLGIPVWLNILYEQQLFSIKNLPQFAKDEILLKWSRMGDEKSILTESIEPLIKYLTMESDKLEEDKFLPNLKRHDSYRNEKYSDFFPEFAKIIGY